MSHDPLPTSFYTVLPKKKKGALRFNGMSIDMKDVTPEEASRILGEAKMHILVYKSTTTRCGWYTDGQTETSHSEICSEIEPRQILVKNGRFFGCILSSSSSFWSYHRTDDNSSLCLVTFESPRACTNHTDHDTDNGEYSSITYVHLSKHP